MKILVTGAAGFIGYHTARHLLDRGDEVVGEFARGAVGVVGCNNPKIQQDYGHVMLTRRLIENDILVLVTGCSSVANGKAGQMMPEAAEMAGTGLREVCQALGTPGRVRVEFQQQWCALCP